MKSYRIIKLLTLIFCTAQCTNAVAQEDSTVLNTSETVPVISALDLDRIKEIIEPLVKDAMEKEKAANPESTTGTSATDEKAKSGEQKEDSVGFTVKKKYTALTLYRDLKGVPAPTESISLSYPVWFKFAAPKELAELILPSNGKTITVQKVILGGFQCRSRPTLNKCLNCPTELTGAADVCSYGKAFWAPSKELADGRLLEVMEVKWGFDVAALNIPVKVRPRRGDYAPLLESDFNLGASFHAKRRLSGHNPYYLSVVGFGSVQALRMDASNNTSLGPDTVENPMALAYGGGLIVELDKIQLGFMLGADAAFGDLSTNYEYQGALWFGFGIGYDLFRPTPANEAIDKGEAAAVRVQ